MTVIKTLPTETLNAEIITTATMPITPTPTTKAHEESYEVIHPLFDAQEKKLSGANLGLIKLTPTVRFSLFLLRAYIIVMGTLLIYHVADLAGLFGHHAAK